MENDRKTKTKEIMSGLTLNSDQCMISPCKTNELSCIQFVRVNKLKTKGKVP